MWNRQILHLLDKKVLSKQMELQLPKVLCSIHQVTLLHFVLHQMSHVDTFDAIGYKERAGRKI